MTTFHESDHPRIHGKFAPKSTSESDAGVLGQPSWTTHTDTPRLVGDDGRDLSYQEGHAAPNAEDEVDASDIEDMFPGVYARPGLYGADAETMATLRAARGNPEAMITIYRGLPTDRASINRGDWVSLSRNYADGHGQGNLGAAHGFHVLSARVRAGDVFTNGDSLDEFGYDGEHHLDFTPDYGHPLAVLPPAPVTYGVRGAEDDMTYLDAEVDEGSQAVTAQRPLQVRHDDGAWREKLRRHYDVEDDDALRDELRADGYDAVVTRSRGSEPMAMLSLE